MIILQIKAKIYQYTGIYLGKKELKSYLLSKKYREDWKKEYRNWPKDWGSKSKIRGLLIGLWESNNGFYRFSTFPHSIVSWVKVFIKQALWDFNKLFKNKR